MSFEDASTAGSIRPAKVAANLLESCLGTTGVHQMRPGSTVAAASACGLQSVGLEIDREYFDLAAGAVPKLSTYTPAEARRGLPCG